MTVYILYDISAHNQMINYYFYWSLKMKTIHHSIRSVFKVFLIHRLCTKDLKQQDRFLILLLVVMLLNLLSVVRKLEES